MSVTRRIRTLFSVKANKALDRVEDPRELLDYSYTKQLALAQQVRRGVADVATSRKRVQRQRDDQQQLAGTLERQAQQALRAGREDLAREALERRNTAVAEVARLDAEEASLQAEEEKLTAASHRLQKQIDDFRVRKETVKAGYTAAQAQNGINEAVAGISEGSDDLGGAMQRALDKTEEMQARASALDELTASGALPNAGLPGGPDALGSELDALDSGPDGGVEAELARMRTELARQSAPAEIEEGRDHGTDPGTAPEQEAKP
jgi:phage shock protein A